MSFVSQPAPSPGRVSALPAGSGRMHMTLDLEHTRLLRNIHGERERADTLRSSIDQIQVRMASIQSVSAQMLTDGDFDELKNLRSELDTLAGKLVDSEQAGDEVDYFVRTADILFKYYDIVEKGTGPGASSAPPPPPPPVAAAAATDSGRSILSYFTEKPKPAPPAQKPAHAQSHAQSHDDRATLFDRYVTMVDNASTQPGTRTGPVGPHGLGACWHCSGIRRTVQLQDGYVFCNDCHTVEYILVDHEKPSYKDPPKEVAYFAYKRINHFNEWLNQVQGKETTDIPDEVYDSILFEIKKQKLTNMATLTRKKVKDILKKLRINKYYEHVPQIINHLNGIPSPHLSPELEDRLRHMFCQIQVPFLKHSPSSRKNFLSYSYCLNKMMQLLEKDQYLESFPLLKSREKLHQQDMIWQKICGEIGWDFIPSL